MVAEELKFKIDELLNGHQAKMWLAKVSGHRLDFVWSSGTAQDDPPEKLAREGNYFLFGQEVPHQVLNAAVESFHSYFRSHSRD